MNLTSFAGTELDGNPGEVATAKLSAAKSNLFTFFAGHGIQMKVFVQEERDGVLQNRLVGNNEFTSLLLICSVILIVMAGSFFAFSFNCSISVIGSIYLYLVLLVINRFWQCKFNFPYKGLGKSVISVP